MVVLLRLLVCERVVDVPNRATLEVECVAVVGRKGDGLLDAHWEIGL